jgi:hypothetical protein
MLELILNIKSVKLVFWLSKHSKLLNKQTNKLAITLHFSLIAIVLQTEVVTTSNNNNDYTLWMLSDSQYAQLKLITEI